MLKKLTAIVMLVLCTGVALADCSTGQCPLQQNQGQFSSDDGYDTGE